MNMMESQWTLYKKDMQDQAKITLTDNFDKEEQNANKFIKTLQEA